MAVRSQRISHITSTRVLTTIASGDYVLFSILVDDFHDPHPSSSFLLPTPSLWITSTAKCPMHVR
jgi:hypothetical protein